MGWMLRKVELISKVEVEEIRLDRPLEAVKTLFAVRERMRE